MTCITLKSISNLHISLVASGLLHLISLEELSELTLDQLICTRHGAVYGTMHHLVVLTRLDLKTISDGCSSLLGQVLQQNILLPFVSQSVTRLLTERLALRLLL